MPIGRNDPQLPGHVVVGVHNAWPRALCRATSLTLVVALSIAFWRRWRIRSAVAKVRKGAKPGPLVCCVLLGVLIRFVMPVPVDLDPKAWSMLALFAATIYGVVSEPLPPPAVALSVLAVGIVTGTLTFEQGVAAFSDEVIWMVLLASFLSLGFTKTGLGNRFAFHVVRALGGTTLSLCYGLNVCEACVAAAMPSSGARSVGVFFPIVTSVARASGSDPDDGTERRSGAFLIQASFQNTPNSSCLWLTGCSVNLLCLRLGAQLGYAVPTFRQWFWLTSMPALLAIALVPLVAYALLPPEAKVTPALPTQAAKKLQEMGPMTQDEWVMSGVMAMMIVLWASSGNVGLTPVATALLGLAILFCWGVLTWDDCVASKGSWTTFVWFAVLVGMSGMLNSLGIVDWLCRSIAMRISDIGMTGSPAFLALLFAYFFSHYFFASQVAHVGALYQPVCALMVRTGTPPGIAVMSLAIASNLFATLTPYASVQAPIFYGARYVSQADWYRLGMAFAIFHLATWLVVGGALVESDRIPLKRQPLHGTHWAAVLVALLFQFACGLRRF
eukprot:CAMPEP_0117468376 /NCGR_PEP_ID=MMETSP0784-20121206/6144_1 /TAXON_ID=39447 /ORGANISM="" /LENGTH=556 /DNA_ID=CAMNT_0005262383 /DNA_START=50 /DNA_END=1716 /DNA_ORIENTATION=-